MGVIRTLLAIAVVVGHSKGHFFLSMAGGMMAVQAFYIISGFYMGMVLTEKYMGKEKGYSLFISNRFLRIFPVYWFMLAITLAISLVAFLNIGHPFSLHAFVENPLNEFPLFYTVFVNLVVLGQDILMFVGIDQINNSFYFTSDFHQTLPRAHSYLLIQPSWTIALEFTFYLLAPFLNRLKTKLLILLVIASFFIRFVMYLNGFYNDPWYYRFFPFEIGFFVLGMLAYRWYKNKGSLLEIKVFKIALYVIFILSICFIDVFPGPYMVKCYLVYAQLFIILPFVFSITKSSSLDRTIGELSYPLYICHYPILDVLNSPIVDFVTEGNKAYILILTSLLVAFLINSLIGTYVEQLRKRRVKNVLIQ